ncbi:MerR family transcriptional regulator [Paenibacillus filicis]|uniref:MerR family transcriptional regulator n=2 Tax=Paenibacillus gyeongsangnamensis TaxID=3388067 RepID=A0ABT4QFV9_9BACL|nr:MerR family transcriptional regulator [Paenibacillus filicis]MCZ8515744.1 MerR family transcriptional regulator [Paenibacillus filicis]
MLQFKIEDVARETGLTKRTIRYYEEIGILAAPQRSEGGVRLYTREHIDRLKRIIDAKDVLGFSLQDLQRYLSFSDELSERRQSYKDALDREDRTRRLLELERMLSEQLELLERKAQKIMEVRSELESLHDRVTKGLARLASEAEQE